MRQLYRKIRAAIVSYFCPSRVQVLHLDSHLIEVAKFILSNRHKKHIVAVRTLMSADILSYMLGDLCGVKCAVSKNGTTLTKDAHGLESGELDVVISPKFVLLSGWSTYQPNIALSCTCNLSKNEALQFSHRARSEDRVCNLYPARNRLY